MVSHKANPSQTHLKGPRGNKSTPLIFSIYPQKDCPHKKRPGKANVLVSRLMLEPPQERLARTLALPNHRRFTIFAMAEGRGTLGMKVT